MLPPRVSGSQLTYEGGFLLCQSPPSILGTQCLPADRLLWPTPKLTMEMDSLLLKEEGYWGWGQQFPGLWKKLSGLDQGPENFFYKGPGSDYFKLCRSNDLYYSYSACP